MSATDRQVIVIAGPTAVGKTALAIRLALHFQTEIVSADSRQIFRELTIGTAKPTAAELAQVKHHFIDTHSIHDDYNAARYGEEAMACIRALHEKHQTVIVCGGSGLYIRALFDGFDDIPEIPEEIRADLNEHYQQYGLGWLQQQMQLLDPACFAEIDQQNPARLLRALEVKIGTGMSIRDYHTRPKKELPFHVTWIGLELPREELYARIDARMDEMIRQGLFEEARALYPLRHKQALQTVGYQEIFGYLEGQYDRAEAIRLLKRNTRRYAKRQLTWFKRDTRFSWVDGRNTTSMMNHL